jgi:hypothetical protein
MMPRSPSSSGTVSITSSPQGATRKQMVETNVFNWLAQGDLSIDDLPSNGDFVATPVQRPGQMD